MALRGLQYVNKVPENDPSAIESVWKQVYNDCKKAYDNLQSELQDTLAGKQELERKIREMAEQDLKNKIEAQKSQNTQAALRQAEQEIKRLSRELENLRGAGKTGTLLHQGGESEELQRMLEAKIQDEHMSRQAMEVRLKEEIRALSTQNIELTRNLKLKDQECKTLFSKLCNVENKAEMQDLKRRHEDVAGELNSTIASLKKQLSDMQGKLAKEKANRDIMAKLNTQLSERLENITMDHVSTKSSHDSVQARMEKMSNAIEHTSDLLEICTSQGVFSRVPELMQTVSRTQNLLKSLKNH